MRRRSGKGLWPGLWSIRCDGKSLVISYMRYILSQEGYSLDKVDDHYAGELRVSADCHTHHRKVLQ
jgi:hypothetical protein